MSAKTKIELIVDTNERKSIPVLRDSNLFSLTVAPIAVGDVVCSQPEMKYCIEIKIGNDIRDLARAKEELSNMAAFECSFVETHLVFIEEGYTPTSDHFEHPWIINSECQRLGVFFHRRKELKTLPNVIKKIVSGDYRKTRIYIKQPPKIVEAGNKTHRALPFVARVLALIDGVTPENALDLYDEIRRLSDKEPGIQDLLREVGIEPIDTFPTWIDEKIGGWTEKRAKIDTDRKEKNYLKLTPAEKIKKYRSALVKRIIATLVQSEEEIVEAEE